MVALALAAALGAACGGDGGTSTAPTYTTPIGAYTIATVDAKAPPVAIFSDSGYSYEVMSGSIVLGADGSYVAAMGFRQTVPGNVSLFADTSQGTWSLAGATVSLTDKADGSVVRGAWSNVGVLTITDSSGVRPIAYVYRLVR